MRGTHALSIRQMAEDDARLAAMGQLPEEVTTRAVGPMRNAR